MSNRRRKGNLPVVPESISSELQIQKSDKGKENTYGEEMPAGLDKALTKRKYGRGKRKAADLLSADSPMKNQYPVVEENVIGHRGHKKKKPPDLPSKDSPMKSRGRPKKKPPDLPSKDSPMKSRGRPKKKPPDLLSKDSPRNSRGRPKKKPPDLPSKDSPMNSHYIEVEKKMIGHSVLTSEASKSGEQQLEDSVGKGARKKLSSQEIWPEVPVTTAKKWNHKEEIVLLSEMVGICRSGNGKPVKNDGLDWHQFASRVSKKLKHDLSKTQVYEKTRRLKARYLTFEQKMNAGVLDSFKKTEEREAYRLSQQIWGDCGPLKLHLEEDDEEPALGTIRLTNEARDIVFHHDDAKGFKEGDRQVKGERENLAIEGKDSLLDSGMPPSNLNEKDTSNANIWETHTEIPVGQVKGERENLAIGGKDSLLDFGMPPSNLNEKDTSHATICKTHTEIRVEDVETETGSHPKECDAQRIFEIIHTEHDALLKQVQKSCQLVLEETKGKLVAMVNKTMKAAGILVPPLGMSSFDILEPATSGCIGDFVGRFRAENRLEFANPAIENLQRRWRQQSLEEIKLTSARLQLMLEGCQAQQERIEQEISKS